MHVVVIGAGVIGSTTALALAERGLEVTLVDAADEAAAGTSHANGSGLTPGHAEPWNPPGTAARLASALLRRDLPYRVYPRALPGLAGWGPQFLRNSTPKRYYANARHTARLAFYSSACLAALRKRHDLDYHQVTDGSLELYFSADALARAIELRRRIDNPNIDFRAIDRDRLIELEPALAPVAGQIHGSLLFPAHESGDACVFSQRVVECAQALGANLRFATTVHSIVASNGRFDRLATDRGEIHADACIISAGCDSPRLLEPLDVRLPIYPVKGYSTTIDIAPGDPAPRLPLLDLQRRFVTARLGDNRLRIAGLADFAGHDKRIHADRFDRLLAGAAALFPQLSDRILDSAAVPWTGLRPMTPDGPPLIGPTRIPGLHLNTGHGAMGWTQAAGSAELVADRVVGERPAISMDGLHADRFD